MHPTQHPLILEAEIVTQRGFDSFAFFVAGVMSGKARNRNNHLENLTEVNVRRRRGVHGLEKFGMSAQSQ